MTDITSLLAEIERLRLVAAPSLAVGDIVCLRSGGPAMPVSGRNTQTGLIPVEWFDDGEALKHGSFEPAMLEMVEAVFDGDIGELLRFTA